MTHPTTLLCVLLLFVWQATAVDFCGNNKNIDVTESTFDGPIDKIVFGGEDNRTVYIITTERSLYRSTDGGRTFSNQRDSLPSITHGVREIYFTSDDDKQVVLGYENQLWFTHKNGASYVKAKFEQEILKIDIHQYSPSYILALVKAKACATDFSKCVTELYVTSDFGDTWELIDTYVNDAAWTEGSKEAPGKDIFYTAWEDKVGAQRSKSVFNLAMFKSQGVAGGPKEKIAEKVAGFLYHNDLIFAAIHTSEGLALMVGTVDSGITLIDFPGDLTEQRYTILDTSEGAIFINVQHSNSAWGNVYSSNATFNDLVISLRFNHRDTEGKVDFTRIAGLDGIYIANAYDLDDDSVTVSNPDKLLRTLITTDKGGHWRTIPAPDFPGGNCSSPCNLNFFGKTSGFKSTILSSSNAVGLVMATGSVGKYLDTRADQLYTWLSRDAGASWYYAADGRNLFAFGDHGGLIVMALDDVKTNEIKYSDTVGTAGWTSCRFSESTMEVDAVISNPSPTSFEFIVYGYQMVNGKKVGKAYFLDFEDFHKKQCRRPDAPGSPDSDYETWIPTSISSSCLLGRQVQYVRRKANARCWNGELLEANKVIGEPCLCTDDDFECDYCFYETNSGKCELDPDCMARGYDPTKQPEKCTDFWVQTQGYRLVPGDACVVLSGSGSTGIDKLPKRVACSGKTVSPAPQPPSGPAPSTSAEHRHYAVFITFVLLLLVLGGSIGFFVYKYKTDPSFYEKVNPFLPSFLGGSKRGAYRPVGSHPGAWDGTPDDEEDNLLHDNEPINNQNPRQSKPGSNSSSLLDQDTQGPTGNFV